MLYTHTIWAPVINHSSDISCTPGCLVEGELEPCYCNHWNPLLADTHIHPAPFIIELCTGCTGRFLFKVQPVLRKLFTTCNAKTCILLLQDKSYCTWCFSLMFKPVWGKFFPVPFLNVRLRWHQTLSSSCSVEILGRVTLLYISYHLKCLP